MFAGSRQYKQQNWGTEAFRRPLASRALLALALLVAIPQPSFGAAWVDTCDEVTTAWKLEQGQEYTQVLAQQRLRRVGEASGAENGYEKITLICPPGFSARFWRETPPSAVIGELAVSIRIWNTQAYTQIVAEVELPRSLDPETKRPKRLLIRPVVRARPRGRAEAVLEFTDLPTAVRRAVNSLKLASPTSERLDERGAYLVRVGIEVPGAPSAVSVHIDEVSIEGRVAPVRRVASDPGQPELEQSNQLTKQGRYVPTEVSLTSDGLRIDGKPFYPRAWRWRGEDPAKLVAIGFNTVWLGEPPSAEQLSGFAELGLKVVCPAPSEPIDTGIDWSGVIAWTLREDLTSADLDTQLAELARIRELPLNQKLPVLGIVSEGFEAWSRTLDGVLLRPGVSGQSESQGGANLYESKIARCSPGAPYFAAVRVDLAPKTLAQIDAMTGEGLASPWLPLYELDQVVGATLSSGARGVLFESDTSVAEPGEPTRITTEYLGLQNERLRLIEPWLVTRRKSSHREPSRSEAVLERSGTKLILDLDLSPTEARPQVRYLANPTTATYRLSPAGVTKNPANSADRYAAAQLAMVGDLLIAGDPRVPRSLNRYLLPRAKQTVGKLQSLAGACESRTFSLTPEDRAQVRKQLAAAQIAASQSNYPKAYSEAWGAFSAVQTADAARCELARGASGELIESTPLMRVPETITEHFRLSQVIAASPRGANRLFGGSFEDLSGIRSHGWRNAVAGATLRADESPGTGVGFELGAGDAIHGERKLVVQTGHTAAGSEAAVYSPPIPFHKGELLEITGWARLRVAPGSEGALKISDTLGGEGLSVKIPAGDAYRPFRLLRASREETTTEIVFRVSGSATAEIDAVMVRPVILRQQLSRDPAGQLK